jgi:formylglycine-generating enzyme required for sulfatase activity
MNATCLDHDTLHAYLLGECADQDAVDAHLDACADCQAALDDLDADVNRPFACLREPAPTADWQQPTFVQLVAQAKAIAAVPTEDGDVAQRTLGNYLLLEPISSASMGRVYKAQHLRLKKIVALKLLAPRMLGSTEARRRFHREMEAVGQLASPNIVTAYDAGEADGLDFLAMEYVDGQNLSQAVRANGALTIDQALDCVLQAARGLAHAHAAGIIHRDVKPSNLLRDAAGTIKVLDLGLAHFLADEALHESGIAGTIGYLPPERLTDPTHADARTDVYGLGCTLYFLLTGKVPYNAATPVEVLAAHRDRPVPSLCEARPDCPAAVDALFRRMIAKDPADRPASMQAVIAEIEQIVQRPTTRRHRFWRIMLAASVLLAASALLAVGFWSGGSGDRKDDGKLPEVAMPKRGAKPEIDMVRIKAGDFFMGASDSDKRSRPEELPRSKVTINRAFFLGKTEITQAQYKEVMGNNPSAFSAEGQFKKRVQDLDTGKHPVESVSWLDAVRFCNKLSEMHGLETYYKIDVKNEVVTIKGGVGYRLPTEAEWEYACRAGKTSTWHFGENADDLKDYAWYAENSGDRTHPVGQKKPNAWGLYDMYGNVPEWCWDRYDREYYAHMPASDPAGSKSSRLRSIRGDGWNARLPRTPAREGLGFTYGGQGSINIVGFRVARNAE